MVRLVDLKERIMIYQFIDHFIALPFETAYFRNLMAAIEGIGGHQFIYIWYMREKKTVPRVGSSCIKPGMDHEF